MKKVILLFTVILSATVARSIEYKTFPEFTSEIKDFKYDHFFGTQSDPERVMAKKVGDARKFLRSLPLSAFQLHDGCAAVFTSNQGYAVTALHCLTGLKRNQKSPLKKEVLFVTDEGKDATTNASIQEMEGHEYENWHFNTELYPNYRDFLPLKLVALGKGYPDIRREWTHKSEEVIKHSDSIKSYIDDYAVIKLNNMPKDHRCVKTADSMPKPGSLTWTVGYPVRVSHNIQYLTIKTMDGLIGKANFLAPDFSVFFRKARALMKDYTNESWYNFEAKQHSSPFYIAVGRAFKNFKQLSKEFTYPIENQNDKLFDAITDQKKYLVSTSFIKPGFSGGGIFNTNKELLGINSSSPATPEFLRDKIRPLVNHVRIDYIKEKVKEKLGPEMADKIFDCQD